ncbi:hypothetical protein QBC34DRAFT_25721 [Podospora aff. communis PSN243]|uniref:Rhodopsin domain-containing protein n=1 Tax=Podospora aff. communis PSN243 TaxID=3040156 RepID=A0AAV9G5B1_9PEZI|nr:hypothetical protein QBC34DRAFT_25721 [Podospora aff. communis PSN243]
MTPPDDDARAATPIAVGVVTVVLTCIVVFLRFVSRGYLLRVLSLTDAAIAFSLVLSIAYTGFMVVQIRTGYGVHKWDMSMEQLAIYFKMVYAALILYSTAIIVTKVSVLLLFLDVFHSTRLRRVAWFTLGLVGIHGTWIVLSNVFFCVPIKAFWDLTISRDRCFEPMKWFIEMWAHIALDFVIFLLPLPVIRSMTLQRRQKMWLCFVFSLGFMVCLVASIRLYYMYHMVTSDDPTYDSMVLIVLCFIELNLSIAIPCLITLKPIVDRVFPGFLLQKDAAIRLADGSPARPNDSRHPPTISSPLPRPLRRDLEMDEG